MEVLLFWGQMELSLLGMVHRIQEAAYNGIRVACEAVSHDLNHLIEDALNEINHATEIREW